MQYYINGSDIKEIYGVDITNAVAPFFAFPDRKESLQHDFPEVNGIDIDLDAPAFSARTFTFNCLLSAGTVADLKNNYFALFTLLKISGTYSIYNDFVDMQIYAFYQKQSGLTAIYGNSNEGYSIKFDLTFGETDPFENIPSVFLVDDQNRYLTP